MDDSAAGKLLPYGHFDSERRRKAPHFWSSLEPVDDCRYQLSCVGQRGRACLAPRNAAICRRDAADISQAEGVRLQVVGSAGGYEVIAANYIRARDIRRNHSNG